MCRVLGVSTSGFYDWFERPESLRQQGNAALLLRIRESFGASDRTYGSPRIVRDLHDDGLGCSENRVARLMQVAGIKARHKRRRQPGQMLAVVHSIAPNLLDRQFGGNRTKPEMGSRLHLRMGGRRLAVCRRRTGPVFPTCRRLVRAANDVGAIGHGRIADGWTSGTPLRAL
jgi:transposase InsO family protein